MQRSLDIDRAIKGAFAAGAVGGAAVALFWSGGSFLIEGGRPIGSASDIGYLASAVVLAWIIATVIFWFGITAFGLPVWAVLHRLGWKGPVQASIAGGLITFVGVFGLMLWIGDGLGEPIKPALWLALDGAVVGLMIERIAYRSPKPPRPSPARPS